MKPVSLILTSLPRGFQLRREKSIHSVDAHLSSPRLSLLNHRLRFRSLFALQESFKFLCRPNMSGEEEENAAELKIGEGERCLISTFSSLVLVGDVISRL
ncbi:hypothetical protein BHE74_00059299 [Ensete ventricosum]|nr:hypothetical protein GW17_00019472 [Ensete ventricosum]RWW35729.1 hypothetical protein BHE74_00059299 [Ensete ventricosum]